MKKELWKPVVNFEEYYEVSNLGRVRRIKTGRILKPRFRYGSNGDDDYLRVNLCANGKKYTYYIHRLVADAFISNPNECTQINHRDEDKTNNDVSNLEWCDAIYNNNYGTRTIRAIETRRENTIKCIGTNVTFNVAIS